jgi:glycosyltransferase involved in cell wall biosynthesis
MKILYFYQYFSTPNGAWGTRVYEFAKEWVEKGHEVTVVSSIYSKSDLTAVKMIENQYFEGIHVKVLNIKIDNKQSLIKRIWSFISFALLSSYYALSIKADVVVASSGPITAWIPGLMARLVKGKKLVLEVRDLWPEGAIELGVIKRNWIKKLSYAFETFSYKKAHGIVCLSPGMKEYISKKAPKTRVISVTNAANISLFSTQMPWPDHIQLTPHQYAIYTGNIGEVNNSKWLLDTAIVLKKWGREDINILLVGDGQQREILVNEAQKLNINNFIHFGLMPKSTLIPLIQHALVSLVPLKGTPVLDTSSPNKFFESLAAGVPVIQNTNGWMKTFLEEHHVGFTVSPNLPEELAQKLMYLDENPEVRLAMGENAKMIAAKEFDKQLLAQKMLTFLEDVS